MNQVPLFGHDCEPLSLVRDHGSLVYYPMWLTSGAAGALLADVRATTIFHADSRMMYGRRVQVPRETAGRGNGMAQPWSAVTAATRSRLESFLATEFDYVFVNRYRNGRDSVAWHGDHDGGDDPRKIVASLSLGATRAFDIRTKTNSILGKRFLSIDLAHGDLVVMRGEFHRGWDHRVRKDLRVRDERINLTFRQHHARLS